MSLREWKGNMSALGAKSKSRGKGTPFKWEGTAQSHARLQLLLSPADFPKGLHLTVVHSEGQTVVAAQLAQCFTCWPVWIVVRLRPDGVLVQHKTKLHKPWAGSREASGKNPTNSDIIRICLLLLAPHVLESMFVCSQVRWTLLFYSRGGCDIWINSQRLVLTDPLNPAW